MVIAAEHRSRFKIRVCLHGPGFEQLMTSSEMSKQCGTLSQCNSGEMHVSSEHFHLDPAGQCPSPANNTKFIQLSSAR